ncbi:IS200/IS605 family element RNA-guided endonuclease TnpB [Caryophanon tenue]|uniref:Transposase n=1 Tax=Caryophanon tenue TaxID=33978 RepID=A0A1C0Y6Q9_9BACL|nr:IS200/IS605 family element RNA-guided endonuclease TnpB [Caryophanon tenue]OCS82842.1 transposase [Caryophanon tenue]
MLKAYKYRMYPNNEQKVFFAKTFGCVRFIYNRMLADRIQNYKEHQENPNVKLIRPTPAQYKSEFEWLREVDSLALANAQQDLQAAYRNFFREPSIGFPKFKSRHMNRCSYKTNNQKGPVSIENGYLKLPKLKSLVRIKLHRQFSGLIKSVTISKTPTNKYYASILVEENEQLFPKLETRVGIDVGLKEFAILSNGKRYDNPKWFRRAEKRLRFLQKALSRKIRGSANYQKARLKVAKLHERIANMRNDFLHKLSHNITNENQVIVMEDLRVKNMLKNRKLAKAISEMSWAQFRTYIEYKAAWKGRDVIIAPSNYASSQLCSTCGYKNSEVKNVSLREWTCPSCHATWDRDMNAARNLVKLAN